MKGFVTGALALAVAGAVASAAAALLPACGVGIPGLNRCPDPALDATLDRTAALDARNAEVLRAVLALERELAAIQCTAVYPPPPAPVPAPPVAALPALPPAPAPAPAIDPNAWAQRDLRLLEGCWDLDSDYAVRNIQTGQITNYTEWTICFDAAGIGQAAMLATNGMTCEGPIRGAFATDGRLAVTEGANLQCSDDTFIYRRELACALAPDGGASCDVSQREVGSTTTVRLRRSAGALP
jgi:hypothetical protein